MASPWKICRHSDSGNPCGTVVDRLMFHSAKVMSCWKILRISCVFFLFLLTSCFCALASTVYHGSWDWYMHFFLLDSPSPFPEVDPSSKPEESEGVQPLCFFISSLWRSCKNFPASSSSDLSQYSCPLCGCSFSSGCLYMSWPSPGPVRLAVWSPCCSAFCWCESIRQWHR